jgi:hypothetical protein
MELVSLTLREVLSDATSFDADFWLRTMTMLGYRIKSESLDIATLKGQKAIPADFFPQKVSRIFSSDYVEVILFDFGPENKLTRSVCTRVARSWKANRLIKPLLLFAGKKDSFAVIVPGKGSTGEAKVLGISDRLYRTDLDVISSMKYLGNDHDLNVMYETSFFPYEKVRNEFFEGYKELYQRTEGAVRRYLKPASTSYAQRFLGRLMFLYFLQKKGWLNHDKNFIQKIADYKALNTLFYQSLNREGTPGIPFLNGSLFEKEDYMDEEMEERLVKDMNTLFNDARIFFDQYNFTVDELAPLELDVSIDPALIGTVFENMLPENERGSKGTFYTPTSESSFICRRAIVNYLTLMDGTSSDGKTFLDGLSGYLSRLKLSKSEKDIRDFREKLLSLRVLDPAVGSGGFLLVMMQEIIRLIQEAESSVGWVSDPEEYKKRILPNLYGFDIEAEAIEIARLRLWLSLIIDQKEPEPLPNLDINLVVIKDSLRLPNPQASLDVEIEELKERFEQVKSSYLNEHDSRGKKRLREQIERLSREIAERTGTDPSVIEAFMPKPANIVVMNPPYVRQEALPEKVKIYYAAKYGLDKKSDLYAYFLVRALQLTSNEGVVSVISSDKWLEVGYGLSLQDKLRKNLIAIYGQRERSFGADINTAITVYRASSQAQPVHFCSLASYSGNEIRQDVVLERKDLRPGKWFYLRAPRVFTDRILPKLTHKLENFAEIKRGFTTGANEFFYLKDISQLFEADRLDNPKKFLEFGVRAKTKQELEKQHLIYVENEGGERFIIESNCVRPLLRTVRTLPTPQIVDVPNDLCLYFGKPMNDKVPFASKYVEWGKHKRIAVTRGSKVRTVIGYHSISTTKSRPIWYLLPHLEPARIHLPELYGVRFLTFYSDKPLLADHLFDMIYPNKSSQERALWLYLNSTVYFTTLELWAPRMGGGALHPRTIEYKTIPVPDLEGFSQFLDGLRFGKRATLPYTDEIAEQDKVELDLAVMAAMGFDGSAAKDLLTELYKCYSELVEDRVVKAGRQPPEADLVQESSGQEVDLE